MVAASTLYGGTYTQFDVSFRRFGYDVTFVEPDDPEDFRKAIKPNTKLLYGETISNPRGNVLDIEAVAKIAHSQHSAGNRQHVCNTLRVPADRLWRRYRGPFADQVHGRTRHLDRRGYRGQWKVRLVEEQPPANQYSFAGLSRHELQRGLWRHCLHHSLPRGRTARPRSCLSPFNAFQFIQGIETLGLRMDRHLSNALAVAQHLQNHALVSWIKYPSLPSSPYFKLAQKYTPKGGGAVFSFGIKGGFEAGKKFIDSLKIFSHLANVGDARSLVIHPSSTTHQQMSREQQEAAGVTEDLIRLSIGLEDIEDILWDLDQALVVSQG